MRVARRALHRALKRGEELHIYLCPECGKWHIGHVMMQERVKVE